MTIPSVTYPLDLTGTNPINLVKGEVHQVPVKKVRAIAPIYGPFFADSMQVIDNATGRLLTLGRDFFITELYVIPTQQSGKDVCSIVMVTDTLASDNLGLNYQVLGGKYSDSDSSLADLLNSIDFDHRNNNWPMPVIDHSAVPQSIRLFGVGPSYGFEHAVQAMDRITQSLSQGDLLGHDAIYAYLEANAGKVTPDLVLRTQYALTSAIAKHKTAADPHTQYFKRTDKINYPAVRTPINKTPTASATGVSNYVLLVGNTYGALYRAKQAAAEFEVSTTPDMANLVVDQQIASKTTQYQPFDLLNPNTTYYWRVRYMSEESVWSDWSAVTSFTTVAGKINQPTITSPANNATNVALSFTMTSSAFSIASGSDTHSSTDWEIWTGPNGTGSRVFSSQVDTVNKTSIAVPANTLTAGQAYYPRVRHRGANLTVTPWSGVVSFVTSGAGVNTPSITSPTNGSTGLDVIPTLTSSAFGVTNTTDTQASSDWEIWTGANGTGTLAFSSYNDASNKTSITVPSGSLSYNTTYHPRVRYHGNTAGVSAWSADLTFTTKTAPPAAGTVLNTRCQGYDLYNYVADGQGGANWVLAQSNSSSCGYVTPTIAKPIWSSTDNQVMNNHASLLNEYLHAFTVNGTGSDTYSATQWELYTSAGALVTSGSFSAASNPVSISSSQVSNNASYMIRARYQGNSLGYSPWSDYIHFSTNWAPSPASGTLLSTYCSGVDKYGTYSDGNYGSYNQLIQANSTDCGYTPPAPPPARGTLLSSYCSGYDLYGNYADGSGGSYSQLIQSNSSSCGYVAPTYPAAGTVIGTQCQGYDLYNKVADGNGGYTLQLNQANSPSCGYTPPTAQAPSNPFSLSSFTATSTGPSATMNLNFMSNGSAQASGSATADGDSGTWLPAGANAADYEVSWSATSYLHTSASYPNDTWNSMSGGILISQQLNSNSTPQMANVGVTVTIRSKIDNSKSFSASYQLTVKTYTQPM